MNPVLDRDKLGRGTLDLSTIDLVMNPVLDRDKLGRGTLDLSTID